jgi:hypothetical protein
LPVLTGCDDLCTAKIVRVDRLAFVSAMVRRRQPGNRENGAAAA